MGWLEWFLGELMLIQMTIKGSKGKKNNRDKPRGKMIIHSEDKESG